MHMSHERIRLGNDQPKIKDLSDVGDELPEEMLELVAGGRMVVWPTYCEHSNPPHICDHQFS